MTSWFDMTPAAHRLEATFAALADPARGAILAHLRRGEVTVLDPAAPFAMSVPAVSRHLKVPVRAEVMERTHADVGAGAEENMDRMVEPVRASG